jgi:hypothetical protein
LLEGDFLLSGKFDFETNLGKSLYQFTGAISNIKTGVEAFHLLMDYLPRFADSYTLEKDLRKTISMIEPYAPDYKRFRAFMVEMSSLYERRGCVRYEHEYSPPPYYHLW